MFIHDESRVRMCRWNNLSENVRTSSTVGAFKEHVAFTLLMF